MGNRAVITIKKATNKTTGIYLHWNGGVESVEAFLTYCDMKGFRSPDTDCYGFAYLSTVIGNFFGDGLSLGVDRIECLDTDNYDNGVYYIEDWQIVSRSYKEEPLCTDKSGLYEALVMINDCQGEKIKVSKQTIIEYCYKKGIPVPVADEKEEEEN